MGEGIINDFHHSEKRSQEKDHEEAPVCIFLAIILHLLLINYNLNFRMMIKSQNTKKIYEYFPLCDVTSPLQHEQVQQPQTPEHQIYENN